MKRNHLLGIMLVCLLALCLLAACSTTVDIFSAEDYQSEKENAEVMDLGEEMVPLTSTPAFSTVAMPTATGVIVYQNAKAIIDASNTGNGYVMIRYLGNNPKVKVLITGPSTVQYQYNISNTGAYTAFPLSDGNGTYSIGIYENISGTQYSTAHTASLQVNLVNQFAPFLLPNQYVNYTSESTAVKKAAELVAGKTTTLQKIEAVYNYVVKNISYDTQLASTVQSGYLPNLETVMANKKGICFDYAALMTAMLRSQNIPTKLVVGYTGNVYHAWINTYSPETGWVDSVIYFDGTQWKLMDPTFASSNNQSKQIMDYIGNGTNYVAKFLY